jgi:hypothetical protein
MNATTQAIRSLTLYQKTILTIYFVVGLPMLPMVPIWWAMRRFIFGDKKWFQPDNRVNLIIETLSLMLTFTLFGSLVLLIAKCTH